MMLAEFDASRNRLSHRRPKQDATADEAQAPPMLSQTVKLVAYF
jgi:hypothetical protein